MPKFISFIGNAMWILLSGRLLQRI